MNSQISERFKIFYIREFTKELVKNSKSTYFLELEALIKERSIKKEESERLKREKIREIVKEKFKKEEKEIREIRPGTMREPLQIIKAKPRLAPRVLTIPQPRLPERFQYLQPSPIEIEMDIGKLNALARDPAVSVIDCPGKGEKIRVMIRNNIKPTGITLAEEEINQIIDKFSAISKIPSHEGTFNVVAGKFILSAEISEKEGSKFTIRKMSSPATLEAPVQRYY